MKSITKNITKKIYGNELISKRDRLTSEISRYWKILANENVIKKDATRNYDMKSLLTLIYNLYDDLVITKLRIQCANLGINFKDLSKDANVINIYKLSAVNEIYVKLSEMMKYHVIKPATKAKLGKAIKVKEELTFNYLRKERDKYSLLSNTLNKKIADFNDNISLETEIPTFLVA